MQYTLIGIEDGSQVISVFIPGSTPLVAHSSHPNFSVIVERVMEGDESVAELFDVALTVSSKFERLSDRVTVQHGRLYFDGDEVDNSLADLVVRFISEGVEDYKPLVRFFDNVQQNPSDHAKEFLFDWLKRNDFQITENGMIVGYKGVEKMNDGTFQSIYGGKAIVNGEVKEGRIPQSIGDVVEMPRSEVHFDSGRACSQGLHAATWGFAQGYNRGAILELHINPRDVVSVPTESGGEKFRCCRYTVIQTLDAPYRESLVAVDYDYEDDYGWGEWDGDDEDYCDTCGERLDNCDDCEDEPVINSANTPQSPKEFLNSFSNVDNAWRSWQTVYPERSMTRDEFRAAVK